MNRVVLIMLVSLFLFAACEKVIDVDLNKSNPIVVIEGNITDNPTMSYVDISKTGSYFGDDPTEKVSDAIVTIVSGVDGEFLLREIEKGRYKSFDIFPQVDKTYTLTVEVDGKKYQSVSKMNPAVNIDSLSFFYDKGFAFFDGGYNLKMYFTDTPDKENFYRIKIFKNGELKNELDDFIVFDDRLVDGQSLEFTLRGKTFEVGDTATVQLFSLDKGAYKYFNSFQELLTTNPGSAAPANPNSNFSNGALGYFSAWTFDSKTIIIKNKE